MSEQQIILRTARSLRMSPRRIKAVIGLLQSGHTIPFIARYRKEATGSLNEVQLRHIRDHYDDERSLACRRDAVRRSIMTQGCWTEELGRRLDKAEKLQEIEDLYRPYKPKRQTKAEAARKAGLVPLADIFWNQRPDGVPPEEAALPFISKAAATAEEAIRGASYIIAERMAELAPYRKFLRRDLWNTAALECTLLGSGKEARAMAAYNHVSCPIKKIPSHRMLAINRGEKQKILKAVLTDNADKHIGALIRMVLQPASPYRSIIAAAAADSYKRLIFPQAEREIRRELTERAEKQAISVFAQNLRSLLLQPPFPGKVILGLDPGYRTGCKAAVIDGTGHVLDYGVCYVTGSATQRRDGAGKLIGMITAHHVSLIAVGNGTASHETEQFVAGLIRDHGLSCRYVIADEAGASVYSASELAGKELPGLDVTIRGAVSIARRIQDPLAEAVKIDPKSIGVGQYQHDVSQKALSAALDDVVESVVNYVGVDLNTASAALLQHVSGLTAATAANIVAFRRARGPFRSRRELLSVPRLGPAAFTQCAGFLRIKDGQEPLDNTSVHPESYDLAKKILRHYGLCAASLDDESALCTLQQKLQPRDAPALAAEFHAGEPTIRDIMEALRKPGRDVRSTFPQRLTQSCALSPADLQIGAVVQGTIRNVTDFGAFVDIGLKTPGLVHRSELCRRYVRHPMDIVHAGDIITAVVIAVDAEQGRIALSMRRLRPKE